METEGQVTESVESSVPESTPAPETPTENVPQGTEPVVETEAPKYTPSFKYKVFGEEKEIPEKYRSLITDATSEKELKDFFEKSEALPSIKQKYEESKQRYATLESTLNTEIKPQLQYYHSLAENLRGAFEKQDFLGVCEALGCPPDTLLGLAAKEATLRQNPAEYKLAQAERERMAATRTAEGQLSAKESQAMEIEARYINRLMEMSMSRDDVKRYADAFDARMGKPGSFELEVRQQGHARYLMGDKADPVGIIEDLMKKFPMQAASTAMAASPAQSSAGTPQVGKPPVIPTVQSGAVSAVPKKSKPKSIREMVSNWEKERNGG